MRDDTDPAELARRQILEVWGQGRVDLIDDLYHADVIDHMPLPGQPQGLQALKDVVRDFRGAMPDLQMTLHGAFRCGDIGVDFWTLEATHNGSLAGETPTGAALRFSGIDMTQVRGDRISDIWHVEELFLMRHQMGLAQGTFGKPQISAPPATVSNLANPGAEARLPDLARLTEREQRTLSVARQHIERLWANGESKLASLLYTDDVIDMNPAPDQRPGIAGIVDVLGWLREAVPDLSMSIQAYAVCGDFAADRWIMRGTHTGAPLMGVPATGKRFQINGMDVIHLNAEDRIDRVWHVEEFAQLLDQISH